MGKKLTPAEVAIQAFGGCRPLGRAIGRNGSSICRWTKPLGEGGSGGHIPTRSLALVLAAAKKMGIKLDVNDLFMMPK